MTDEVSLDSQSRVWLAPYPFLSIKKEINLLKEYLKAQNKTNETVLGNAYSPDELDRFSKSDYRWADNRTKPFRHRIVKKGEIYQFEFGKNYIPEMSYEHRGLVIGVKQKLLHVLPRDYPKVCVNLQTGVRYNYPVWRFYYGKKKRQPTKSGNEGNDA